MTMRLSSLHTLEISTSSAKRVPPEWTSTGDKRWKGAHKLRHVLLSGAEICSLSFTVKVFPKVCKPKLMLDAFRKRALCAVLSILGFGMRRR